MTGEAAVKRIVTWVVSAAIVLGQAGAAFGQPAPGAAPDGFEKVTQLPPVEQLPAAPMVIGAYAFIWVALLVYVFLLWRRLGGVDRELAALRRSLEERQ
jgi:CcmD family protein